MTNNEFRYWINGYLILTDEDFVNTRQINIIKNHANLVKAIMGSLEEDIGDFILRLQTAIKTNARISLDIIKQIASILKWSNFFKIFWINVYV